MTSTCNGSPVMQFIHGALAQSCKSLQIDIYTASAILLLQGQACFTLTVLCRVFLFLGILFWMDTKAKDPGNVRILWPRRFEVAIGHEEEVRERGSKVCPIDVPLVFASGIVDILAFWTKEFDGADPRYVGLSHRKQRLSRAEHPWTPSHVYVLVFLQHSLQSSGRQDIPRVDESIQHLGCTFGVLEVSVGEHVVGRRVCI